MQKYSIDIKLNKEILLKVIKEIANTKVSDNAYKQVEKIIRTNPGKDKKLFSKSQIIKAYQTLNPKLNTKEEENFKVNVKMKDIRTISGVTPITVLTKPFPCPGKCIFCPNDTRMPKSYLVDEPGAQRALSNKFDPYAQTINRLIALQNIGHSVSKAEIIVLGGTWSSYPKSYQIWFIKRCFDALNDFSIQKVSNFVLTNEEQPFIEEKVTEINGEDLNTTNTYNRAIAKALNTTKQLKEKASWEQLFKAQKVNEKAKVRCIGLSIETRPDEINQDEVINIRKLGATKVQLGVQSLNNKVLKLNKRGHNVNQTALTFNLLRKAGFKIQIHYMPNLYGSSVEKDISDFKKLFSNKDFKPDEIKLYPCSLIQSAELIKYYKKGLWKPYTKTQLLKVIVANLNSVKEYCRVTRVVRDIPSTDIVFGNKLTNFRQIAENYIKNKNIELKEIRSREIKNNKLLITNYKLKITKYKTTISTELFLQFVDNNNTVAGFLRLSIPNNKQNFIKELENSTIIREIHVYGQALNIGEKQKNKAQHTGLGTKLIKKAEEITKSKGFNKISVISSIGTREYYKKRGFKMGNLYQYKDLN